MVMTVPLTKNHIQPSVTWYVVIFNIVYRQQQAQKKRIISHKSDWQYSWRAPMVRHGAQEFSISHSVLKPFASTLFAAPVRSQSGDNDTPCRVASHYTIYV